MPYVSNKYSTVIISFQLFHAFLIFESWDKINLETIINNTFNPKT